MKIDNLTGLEKPIQKLVETVSEGVGVIGNHIFKFDVTKIKRIGEAEIEIEKEKIIAKADAQEKAIEVLDRAGKRFALEQFNKQINLENIFVRTREDLEGKKVSKGPVEKDWIMRFLDISQNISREDLQDLLSKILSGEIQKPKTYSHQTLEVIKYISKRDLEKFFKFIAISTNTGIIKIYGNDQKSLEKYGFQFQDYLDLSSIGLFNQSSTISYTIELSESINNFLLNIGKNSISIFTKNKKEAKKLSFGLYAFSNVGKELRSLLIDKATNEKLDLFKEDLIREIKAKGFKVKKIK
ncbi:MAG: DUF2806 domain-containing protein [Patescibacteria group bacterium]|nr:DUF2806 domain-containing protein [Patescibacteria group bacterium]